LVRILSPSQRCTGCIIAFWKPTTSILNIRPMRLARAGGIFMDCFFPMKFWAVCIGTMLTGF
jgi:hypothetical protein